MISIRVGEPPVPPARWDPRTLDLAVPVAFAAFVAVLPSMFAGAAIAMIPWPTVGTFLWNCAFAVFPKVCAAHTDFHDCAANGGWWSIWSYFVWGGVLALFIRVNRGRSLGARVLIAILLIANTILAMQFVIFLHGGWMFVDSI